MSHLPEPPASAGTIPDLITYYRRAVWAYFPGFDFELHSVLPEYKAWRVYERGLPAEYFQRDVSQVTYTYADLCDQLSCAVTSFGLFVRSDDRLCPRLGEWRTWCADLHLPARKAWWHSLAVPDGVQYLPGADAQVIKKPAHLARGFLPSSSRPNMDVEARAAGCAPRAC